MHEEPERLILPIDTLEHLEMLAAWVNKSEHVRAEIGKTTMESEPGYNVAAYCDRDPDDDEDIAPIWEMEVKLI